jgi:muramidase (phage lysozyme)
MFLVLLSNNDSNKKVITATFPEVQPKDTLIEKLAKAVAKIESNHNPKARRFEPSVFKRLTGQYASTSDEAKKINWNAAMRSTSIGKYQILAKWYKKAGYKSITEMCKANSARQDSAFIHFIKAMKYDKVIRKKDWRRFAFLYNGKGYKKNNYHNKLTTAMQ